MTNGSIALVDVVPDLFLTGLVDYDAQTQTVTFDGAKATKILNTGTYKIKITLIDENNLKTEYVQLVAVNKPQLLNTLEPENQEKTKDAVVVSLPLEDKADQRNKTIDVIEPSLGLSIETNEYNLAIKKPWLDSIELSGRVELQFTKLRMQGVDELRDPT